MSQPQPMDIDPIDGGPKDIGKGPPPPPPKAVPMQISEEEEARQAIDMFRGDDMSARVKAANRLEAIASVLGEQRTREVCSNDIVMLSYALICVLSIVLRVLLIGLSCFVL